MGWQQPHLGFGDLLHDVDIVISKAVVYRSLAVFVSAVYAARRRGQFRVRVNQDDPAEQHAQPTTRLVNPPLANLKAAMHPALTISPN